jgi:2-oxo-hept-3-ene-1,7-dioate hydratase
MEVDLRWASALLYRNADIEESGVAAGVLGHPAVAIAWLSNKVAFTRPVWARKGDTLRADFGPLGSLSVQFV